MKTITNFIIEKLKINKDIKSSKYADDVYSYIEELAYRWTEDHKDKDQIKDFIQSKEEPEWDLLISTLKEEYIDIKNDYHLFDKEVVDDTINLFKVFTKLLNSEQENTKEAIIKGMTRYVVENY